MLVALEGTGREELRTRAVAHGVAAEVLDAVLERLLAAGLVGDSRPIASGSTEGPVRVVGAGVLGRAVAAQLRAAGVPLELCDDTPADEDLYPHAPLGATRAQALAAEFARPDGPPGDDGLPTALRSAPAPRRDSPDALTVLACDTWEPDRVVTDALLREDRPHLLVRPFADGVVVGPLVVPGRSACVNCLDAARTATDPGWPALLALLTRRPARPPADLVTLAAVLAVTQACGWREGRRAELVGATVTVLPPDRRLRIQRWPRHPACGCGGPAALVRSRQDRAHEAPAGRAP